jgi:hypothetical protein
VTTPNLTLEVQQATRTLCKHCGKEIRLATPAELSETEISVPDWIHADGIWMCGKGNEAEPASKELGPLEAVRIVTNAITVLSRGEKLTDHAKVMEALHIVFNVCRDKELEAL